MNDVDNPADSPADSPVAGKLPDLSGLITKDDVKKKDVGGGVDYVNWSRAMELMRQNTGHSWFPECVQHANGSLLHPAGDGSFLLHIRYVNSETFQKTVIVPFPITDNGHRAKKSPTATDISNSYVRGIVKAANVLFGLAWQLPGKDPLDEDVSLGSAEDGDDFATKWLLTLKTCSNGKQLHHQALRLADQHSKLVKKSWDTCLEALGDRMDTLGISEESRETIRQIFVNLTKK